MLRKADKDKQQSRDRGLGETPGRAESSPGHRKKAAGVQSARDYTPGHGRQDPADRGKFLDRPEPPRGGGRPTK